VLWFEQQIRQPWILRQADGVARPRGVRSTRRGRETKRTEGLVCLSQDAPARIPSASVGLELILQQLLAIGVDWGASVSRGHDFILQGVTTRIRVGARAARSDTRASIYTGVIEKRARLQATARGLAKRHTCVRSLGGAARGLHLCNLLGTWTIFTNIFDKHVHVTPIDGCAAGGAGTWAGMQMSLAVLSD